MYTSHYWFVLFGIKTPCWIWALISPLCRWGNPAQKGDWVTQDDSSSEGGIRLRQILRPGIPQSVYKTMVAVISTICWLCHGKSQMDLSLNPHSAFYYPCIFREVALVSLSFRVFFFFYVRNRLAITYCIRLLGIITIKWQNVCQAPVTWKLTKW